MRTFLFFSPPRKRWTERMKPIKCATHERLNDVPERATTARIWMIQRQSLAGHFSAEVWVRKLLYALWKLEAMSKDKHIGTECHIRPYILPLLSGKYKLMSECFSLFQPKDCEGPQDCRGNGALTGCCNNFCCEEKYYQQYKALPCVTDFGCKVGERTAMKSLRRERELEKGGN